MLAVIFEAWPHPQHLAGYLHWAEQLKAELLQMEGFNRRFVRDYGLNEREQAPADSRQAHG
jgi:hypothetical protein